MSKILPQAQALVGLLLSLMPTYHQRRSLQALLGLFLEAQGHPLPEYCQDKSPAALSRFLNCYSWPTRAVIRQVRAYLVQVLLAHRPKGRRPHLQLILDLTCLPKRGRFKALAPLIRVFHGKRGLHVVLLYVVVGHWRFPWGARVYRGKGTPSQAQLGLRLLRTIPKPLKQHFRIMVLADGGFGSIAFLQGVRQLDMHALVGVSRQRCIHDGRHLHELVHSGSQVRLRGWDRPVWVGWYWFKREKGEMRQRFVVCTRRLKGPP
ncbi:MAG: transposase [Cyanophyceae cyanobacterium]|mgnify:FL=1